MRPEDLILRCYAHRTSQDRWYAHCIDLNLDAEASTLKAVKSSLDFAISGYVQTVEETDDKESLTYLLPRPSPMRHVLFYHSLSKGNRPWRN